MFSGKIHYQSAPAFYILAKHASKTAHFFQTKNFEQGHNNGGGVGSFGRAIFGGEYVYSVEPLSLGFSWKIILFSVYQISVTFIVSHIFPCTFKNDKAIVIEEELVEQVN